MLLDILKLNEKSESVKEFYASLRRGEPLAVFGVENGFKNFLVSGIKERVLYVVKDGITAISAKEAIESFSDKKVYVLPAKDEMLLSTIAYSKENVYNRIQTLSALNSADVIIVTAECLVQTHPKSVKTLTIKEGEEYSFSSIAKELISMGYAREESADIKGTFAVRGDIIDVYPAHQDFAYRLDFFGDEVDSVKIIQPESRKTIKKVSQAEIVQSVENVFTPNDYSQIKTALLQEINSASGEKRAKLKLAYDDCLLAMENNNYSALSVYASVVNKTAPIFDLISEDTVVVIDEGKLVYETAKLSEREFSERYLSLSKSGDVISSASKCVISVEQVIQGFTKFKKVSLQTFSGTNQFFSPIRIITPEVNGVTDYKFAKNEIFADIRTWLKNNYKVVICVGNNKNYQTFGCDLALENIPYFKSDDKGGRGVELVIQQLKKGFIVQDAKTILIGSGNLFTGESNEKKSKKALNSGFFSAPEAGDYCVHETHGIGKVLGNRKISTTESTKDYVAVEYLGGDVLYVPVEQLDMLTRYYGANKTPKLSKLGGSDFERIKGKVVDSIKAMSFDLKELYKKRSMAQGFAFVEDEETQAQFENAFAYEDTPDQHRATLDVKRDMNSERVMDRLICGDVGFGKTEVAFRAVFRAIVNGKQAAMLAPTTILTEQHFNTAKERFKDFAINIKCLNRFSTPKEQEKILQELKEGKIDFIIGTHRLLSSDVSFKNLGLLVLDEEQRFGVEHKEKIKLIKNNVDTLTLTATPIPRTLHMSLSGIREISTINTPPKKRLPVQVYVAEETETLIRDAVLREVNRGGQVFLLYNRVETIFDFAGKIQKLVPNVKTTVIHGQMDERTIEKSIVDFYSGKSQLLIATTIIENGIDLPRANTIIVIDADKMGLSTLYQLKGRVGRSDRLACAYLTYKRDKVLTANAYDRLSAIIEFAEMGSGIKIAMKDLEIRGAGNVLGAEQHGHMDKIGYELYSKLLKEELTGEAETSVELDIRVTAYIPESYIQSNSARMEAYKRIAEIKGIADAKEIKDYLTDSYGQLPAETETLITISLVKFYAGRLGVKEIVINKEYSAFIFDDLSAFSSKKLQNAMDYSMEYIRIVAGEKPTLEFIRSGESNERALLKMLEFLLYAEK